MPDNVYIVESPTQLMSAIEAKNTQSGRNTLIVNYGNSNREENKKQIQQLVNSSAWNHVFRIRQSSNQYFNLFLFLFYLLKFRFKFNRNKTKVYIGEYRNSFFCLIAKVISKEKIVLLDDGSVTIMLQKKFFSKGVGLRSYYKNKKSYIIFLIYSYLFVFDFDDSPPNLFSVFNLDACFFSDQKNIRHKNIPTAVGFLDRFYFFGAKYSEAGLLDLKVELELLKSAFDYSYKKYGKAIVYIAHRDDSSEKLEVISSLGVEVKSLGQPCEEYFKIHKCVPRYIGGFYSTSIISLPTLFKVDGVISFNLTKYLATESPKKNVGYIYGYLKSIGTNIVEL